MLSILHREMRVASRRPGTFRVRLLTMIGAFIVAVFLVATGVPGGGAWVFNAMKFLAFWFCLAEGVRRAAGSIADEKRDGTLGLLFLTPLKPRDIIGAKLFSVMMPVLQPLLAIAPVFSICLLLGGVMPGEVLRTMLLLFVVLSFSISVGLMISAGSRKAEQTGSATSFFLIIWVFIPYLLKRFWSPAQFLSPWTAYEAIPDPAYRIVPEIYWTTLFTLLALSFAALAIAAFYLPRRWEEEKAGAERKSFWRRQRAEIPPQARAKYLDGNPGEWLAARFAMGRAQQILFNLAMLGAVLFGVFLAVENRQAGLVYVPLLIAAIVIFLRIASQASYPLAEARRSGAIEMILSTPLHPESFVEGQKKSLIRQFWMPLTILTVGAFLAPLPVARDTEIFAVFAMYMGFLIVGTGAFAYFGMWMGLRLKSANAAFFYTIILLLVAPALFSCVAFLFA